MNDLAQSMRQVRVNLRPSRAGMQVASVFLHTSGQHGPEGLLERLNNQEPFLPLKGEDGQVRLVAKSRIAAFECLEEPDELVSLRELLPSTAAVRIHMRDGSSFEGDLMLLLPGAHHRVLDFLNGPGRFFLLVRPTGTCFVNKDWIDFVNPAPETP